MTLYKLIRVVCVCVKVYYFHFEFSFCVFIHLLRSHKQHRGMFAVVPVRKPAHITCY